MYENRRVYDTRVKYFNSLYLPTDVHTNNGVKYDNECTADKLWKPTTK